MSQERHRPPAFNTNAASQYARPGWPVLLTGDRYSGLVALADALAATPGVACLRAAFVADDAARWAEVQQFLPDPQPSAPARAEPGVWNLSHVWRRVVAEGAGRYRAVVVPASLEDLDARARCDDIEEAFAGQLSCALLLRNPLSCYADALLSRVSWERQPVAAEATAYVRRHEAWKRRLDELPGRAVVFAGPDPAEAAQFFAPLGAAASAVEAALVLDRRPPAQRLGEAFARSLPKDARAYAHSSDVV